MDWLVFLLVVLVGGLYVEGKRAAAEAAAKAEQERQARERLPS